MANTLSTLLSQVRTDPFVNVRTDVRTDPFVNVRTDPFVNVRGGFRLPTVKNLPDEYLKYENECQVDLASSDTIG